jgi:hypothetical protein
MSNHVYSARLNVTLSQWCQLVPLFETISVRTIRQKRFNQTQVEIVDAPIYAPQTKSLEEETKERSCIF